MQSFLTEKTYVFVNRLDSSDKVAWKMKAAVVGQDTIFETSIYNGGKLTEKITEKAANGSSRLTRYEFFNGGKSSVGMIGDAQVYRCDLTTSELISWSVSYSDPLTSRRVLVQKLRSLESSDETKQVFEDNMRLYSAEAGINYSYKITFTYEKGKGAVSYIISAANSYLKEYYLAEIR